ncbi:hypothetical protein, partial [Flavobacterium sp. YO64]|uniref:hypothetical protein n=1 Tax=Flavobacterium sp. YO64 TaxID=394559 RepID=UPI0010267437
GTFTITYTDGTTFTTSNLTGAKEKLEHKELQEIMEKESQLQLTMETERLQLLILTAQLLPLLT